MLNGSVHLILSVFWIFHTNNANFDYKIIKDEH